MRAIPAIPVRENRDGTYPKTIDYETKRYNHLTIPAADTCSRHSELPAGRHNEPDSNRLPMPGFDTSRTAHGPGSTEKGINDIRLTELHPFRITTLIRDVFNMNWTTR